MLQADGPGWVAEAHGQPVGFSMVNVPEPPVFACYIRPGYEGRGLGQQLMAAAEAGLAQRDVREAWLSTGTGPAVRANGFYRRLGWQNAGVLPDGQMHYVKNLV